MLKTLTIQNYALIQQLSIDFNQGLSIITGETGAGKSILLGALGLVLGNRADLSSLKDTTQKCVIEAQLQIENYNLNNFFEQEDLDYETETIIRREILPSGKSRAFVNDTPVNLSVLNELKTKLIDIHSQHQTLQLSDTQFQFDIIDALANNSEKKASYSRGLQQYKKLQNELAVLLNQQKEAKQQYDYNLHLFNELEEAKLLPEEQEQLEEKLEKLNNIEAITSHLATAIQASTQEEVGAQSLLHTIEHSLQKIANFSKEYAALANRILSVKIEFDDIINELEITSEKVDVNPHQIEQFNDRLQLIYNLQKKHQVSSNVELLTILEQLATQVNQVENASEIIAKKEQEIATVTKKLDTVAQMITSSRQEAIPKLKTQLENLLIDLGMPNARFSITINPTDSFFYNGKDELAFLFSANKGSSFGTLKKIASGGELSRIMLAIKKMLSENTKLPTIIFDEIDTGVSGEISQKIAGIMEQMSKHMQVITITHLPQIASRGTNHYKVYKEETNGTTTTRLKSLSPQERTIEIAEMLSGKDITDSALLHAKELLN